MLNLSQQEYVNRIDELNNQLISAWDQDQRVKALKIAIQVGAGVRTIQVNTGERTIHLGKEERSIQITDFLLPTHVLISETSFQFIRVILESPIIPCLMYDDLFI